MSHIRTALDYVHKTTARDCKLAACRGGEDRQVVGRREGGEHAHHRFAESVEEGVKSSQVKSSQAHVHGLPYGCLLFMYRLDLTCVKGCEGPTRNTDYNCRRETVSAFFHQDFLKSKNLFISS